MRTLEQLAELERRLEQVEKDIETLERLVSDLRMRRDVITSRILQARAEISESGAKY